MGNGVFLVTGLNLDEIIFQIITRNCLDCRRYYLLIFFLVDDGDIESFAPYIV